MGWLDAPETFYRQIDLLVLPSRSESFGKVIIEAMARRKLVVATRSGGPETIIEHQRTGWLVPPRDPLAMANTLTPLLTAPEQYAAQRQAACLAVASRWTSDKVIPGLIAFLQQLPTTPPYP